MRALLIAMAAGGALALASCQTTKFDGAIEQNLPKACQTLEAAHVAFTAVASLGNVKASTIAKEQAAYGGVIVICADPASTDLGTALVKVAQAYVIISTALKEANG